MPLKKPLIEALLRLIAVTDLEDLKRKEIIIRLSDGSEMIIKVNVKERLLTRLRIVGKD